MGNMRLGSIYRLLYQVLDRDGESLPTDAQLLERFATSRDEAAFELLVRRHGKSVWNACRRVLVREHDIEDAFQATFLILTRKASSVSWSSSVAGWLRKVARRVATQAKAKASSQSTREQQRAVAEAVEDSTPAWVWQEMRSVLDEEIERLPRKYRLPFVLCHLEGKTNAEAGKELGCTESAIAMRLVRARQRLAKDLSRRGVTLPTGWGAVVVLDKAAVPAQLISTTVRAGLTYATNGVRAGIVSASAVTLAEEVAHTTLITKIVFVVGLALSAGLMVGGTSFVVSRKSVQSTEMTKTERTSSVSVLNASEKKADSRQNMKENRHNDSIVQKATIGNTMDAEAYYRRGGEYFQKGDYGQAIKNFDEALRLKPQYIDAFYSRGYVYELKGDHDRAIKDYDETLRLDPKRVWAYNNRGYAYMQKGNYDRAIEDYNEALQLDSQNSKAYYNRGWAYKCKTDYDQATKDCDEALRLIYGRDIAYGGKAEDYDRVIDVCTEAIQFDPKWSWAYKNRGYAYMQKGNYDRAIEDYNEALQLNPKYVDALYGRGYVYSVKADYDKAIKDYNEALQLNPKHVDAFCGRSYAHKHKRDGADYPTTALSNIARTYGIEIVFADPVFPVKTSWNRFIDGHRADKGRLADFAELFVQEFSLYPRTLVKHCKIKRIVLCKDLTSGSQRLAGCLDYDHQTIYYDVAYFYGHGRQWLLCNVVHHEVFHAIDFSNDRKDSDDNLWSSLTSPVSYFRYGAEVERSRTEANASSVSDEYPGFLTTTPGVTEDKAEVFAKLMVQSTYVEGRIKKDTVLRAKVARIKELVASLCPEMNEAFWTRAKQIDRSTLGFGMSAPTPNGDPKGNVSNPSIK